MNVSRKLILWVCMLLLAVPSFVHAADQGTSLQMNYVSDGHRLKLSVKAIGAVDLYAYDLKLSFDAANWKLIHSSSDIQGFSVPSKVEGNDLRFAHTQIGSASGKNGNVGLASFVFERMTDGDSTFELREAKLVNAKIDSKVYTPNLIVEAKTSGAPLPQLTDIDKHWAKDYIQESINLGIVNGYTDGTFRPEQKVTRAEFAVMLLRGLNIAPLDPSLTDKTFADSNIIPTWARGYASAGFQAGLMQGYEDGTFMPGRNISRIELAAMTVRSLDKTYRTTPATAMKDYNAIPAWGQGAANTAIAAGLMNGKGDNQFEPNSYTSRAEAITVIMRLLRVHLKYDELN
ncbi:S-layer homology domain-containing protein [Paenibacillus sp. strain BS8-2]